MFNVGGPEIMVIILVALLVLGPQQLPKAMKTFGTVMGEIRKVSSGFQAEMKSAMETFTEEPKAAEKPHSAVMATPDRAEREQASLAEPSTSTTSLEKHSLEKHSLEKDSAASDDQPAMPEQAEVSEVRGRNDDPIAPGPTSVVDARPAIDPADRAAG